MRLFSKQIKKIASLCIGGISVLSLCACGGEEYYFYYKEDSYSGDLENIFEYDWDTLSAYAEMDGLLEKELPEKTVVFDGKKLKGLFNKEIEMYKDEERDEWYYDMPEFGEPSELKRYIKENSEIVKTKYGNVYVMPDSIECEVMDEELYAEVLLCTEKELEELDLEKFEKLYLVDFTFKMSSEKDE